MTLYLKYRPDYFPRSYTQAEFERALSSLVRSPEGSVLCLGDAGLTTATKVYAFWQKFIAYLGFTNSTERTTTNYELLKLVFYGIAHRYCSIEDPLFKSLSERLNTFEVNEIVKQSFDHLKKERNEEKQLAYLRVQLQSYDRHYRPQLQPGFWRSFIERKIPDTAQAVAHLDLFGTTYLKLVSQTFEDRSLLPEKRNSLAVYYYQQATHLYNSLDPLYFKWLINFHSNFRSIRDERMGSAYANIAERECLLGDYSQAYQHFVEASDRNHRFTTKQKLYLSIAAINRGLLGEAASQIQSVNTEKLSDQEKELYARGCALLGDKFFSQAKAPTLASVFLGRSFVEEDCYRAISYFQRINRVNPTAYELQQPKILDICRYLVLNLKKTHIKENCLTPEQHLALVQDVLKEKRFKDAEDMLTALEAERLSQNSKIKYAACCITLGDQAFSNRDAWSATLVFKILSFGQTLSFEDHSRRALHFYRKAERSYSGENPGLQSKILAISQSIKPDKKRWKERQESGLHNIANQKWESAVTDLLVAMMSLSREELLTTKEGQSTIAPLNKAFRHFFADKKNTPKGLEMLDQALRCIGDVKELLPPPVYHDDDWFSKDAKTYFNSHDEPFFQIIKEGRWIGDVGAMLHFFKGQVMQELGFDWMQVKNAYVLAWKLAPNNPYGWEAFFMTDDELDQDSRKDAESYRAAAAHLLFNENLVGTTN